tara:strand:- start:149 stop:289 length:141 start_codon:yes stop_codon:yes gene_type:complete
VNPPLCPKLGEGAAGAAGAAAAVVVRLAEDEEKKEELVFSFTFSFC